LKDREEGVNFLSEDLKILITSIIDLDPNNRPTIADILSHNWFNGPTMTKEEVI
jgi:serine/threonine protein kinase